MIEVLSSWQLGLGMISIFVILVVIDQVYSYVERRRAFEKFKSDLHDIR